MKHLLFIGIVASLLGCNASRHTGSTEGNHRIREDGYLMVNNDEQYVSIRGRDTLHQPLLLLLHGGPGASATPLMQHFNQQLENDFTVVYWDQRGAGLSWKAGKEKNTCSVELYLQDAAELIRYLLQRFRQQKLYLVGHSWGARLGMYLIRLYPDLISAYIGTGQEVAAFEGERQSYLYTLEEAGKQQNRKALHDLETMGLPRDSNYLSMYQNGFRGLVQQKEWLLKLGGERYGKTHYRDWIRIMLRYYHYNPFALMKWSKASASTAGRMFHDPGFNSFDLRRDIPEVKVPVCFISGKYDYNTPWVLVKSYADSLRAPEKKFILLEKSGHSPIFEEPQTFNRLVKEWCMQSRERPR